jgi:hypothetical protein
MWWQLTILFLIGVGVLIAPQVAGLGWLAGPPFSWVLWTIAGACLVLIVIRLIFQPKKPETQP